ncbi:pyridoxamine 5'-phosphate oxidase family protein [Patescibacteria group bacterium]|nr:pyridoxamine 5'-phosphate oxidase family protein [Patescibacteria group bacterium]
MKLSEQQRDTILNASSKALATYSDIHTLNVVPVSTVRIVDHHVVLCNYFMNKTRENIVRDYHIALTCWSNGQGLQIKGTAQYLASGDLFEHIQKEVIEMHPERTLCGIIVVTVDQVFDISLPNTV